MHEAKHNMDKNKTKLQRQPRFWGTLPYLLHIWSFSLYSYHLNVWSQNWTCGKVEYILLHGLPHCRWQIIDQINTHTSRLMLRTEPRHRNVKSIFIGYTTITYRLAWIKMIWPFQEQLRRKPQTCPFPGSQRQYRRVSFWSNPYWRHTTSFAWPLRYQAPYKF